MMGDLNKKMVIVGGYKVSDINNPEVKNANNFVVIL